MLKLKCFVYVVELLYSKSTEYSTIVIILSSLSAIVSFINLKEGNLKKTNLFLIIAFILGLIFAFFQFAGWSNLVSEGHFYVIAGFINWIPQKEFVLL